jgi:hypothetical protein
MEVPVSAVAHEIEAAIKESPDVLRKWQAIQDNLVSMPPNALRDMIVDLVQGMATDDGPVVTDAVVAVIDDWYRRCLFAQVQQGTAEEPVLTEQQWDAQPERRFDGLPKPTPR